MAAMLRAWVVIITIGERHCHRSEGEGRKCEKRIGEGVDEVFLNTLKKVMEWKNGKNETT